MFLAVAPPVIGPAAIGLLLLRVHASKVIWILRAPPLIELVFLLAATLLPATGCLSLFDARVRHEKLVTKRTLPPLRHKGLSPGMYTSDRPSMSGSKWNQKGKEKEKRRRRNREAKGKSSLSLFRKN
jgi:hypothetical protein